MPRYWSLSFNTSQWSGLCWLWSTRLGVKLRPLICMCGPGLRSKWAFPNVFGVRFELCRQFIRINNSYVHDYIADWCHDKVPFLVGMNQFCECYSGSPGMEPKWSSPFGKSSIETATAHSSYDLQASLFLAKWCCHRSSKQWKWKKNKSFWDESQGLNHWLYWSTICNEFPETSLQSDSQPRCIAAAWLWSQIRKRSGTHKSETNTDRLWEASDQTQTTDELWRLQREPEGTLRSISVGSRVTRWIKMSARYHE